MARESMTSIIAFVRGLLSVSEADFSDDDIQTALDTTRRFYKYLPLRAVPTLAHNGPTQYFEYLASDDYWEDGYALTDSDYTALSDTGSEPLLGVFRFTSSQDPPLFLSGHAYDAYTAAALVAERWAARLSLDFDFSTDGGSYSRSQKASALRATAADLRAQGKPAVMAMLRDDENG